MCKPKQVGGLGFKTLHDFNLAMMGKQGWKLSTKPSSLVAKLYKCRYYPTSTFKVGIKSKFFFCHIIRCPKRIHTHREDVFEPYHTPKLIFI